MVISVKVLICGAGIAGLTAAIQISAIGAEVTVLEKSGGLRGQGYMVDIVGAGYAAIEAMNLLPTLKNVAYQMDGAYLVDERGRRGAYLPYALAARVHRGRLLSVMRPDLEKVLHDNLPSRVDLRWNSTVVGVDNQSDQVMVRLASGERLDGDLLIGADGIHSTVRRCVFGDERQFLRYLGLRAAAFIIDAPSIAGALGECVVLTDTIGREMGCYVLRDGRVAVFAVHYAHDSRVPDDRRAAIREAFRGLGWVVPDVLERCPGCEEIYYDQIAQIEMPRWSRDGVALLGDASYAVSLMAGHGATLGIAGAYVLAERLAVATTPEIALAEYQRLLRPLILQKQQYGRNAARWLVPTSATGLRVRRALLRIARIPVIDRWVGSAIAGQDPPLIGNPAN